MPRIARIAANADAPAEWAFEDADGLWGNGLPAGAGDDPIGLTLVMDGVTTNLKASARSLNAEKVQWLTLLARPGKVICLGLNYAAYAAEVGREVPDYPAFFMRGATSLIAHRAPLVRPRVSQMLDYEAELAVVIGRQVRQVTSKNALHAVAAYTCFNDGSLRDYQRRSTQWTMGKNFDGTGPIGPWLTPASALPPGAHGLKIESRLNGRVMQSDNTAHMTVSVEQALILVSEVMTLEPGDVIAMGTPAGVGFAQVPPVWMQTGDHIEIELEGVGLLVNTVSEA